MSVKNIDTEKYKQIIISSKENKLTYGEINTPFSLINKMLDILPQEVFQNPELTWLDPCCGCGYFMIVVFQRLYYGLKRQIPDDEKRENHIINNMLYMVEINSENKNKLFDLFGKNANIIINDFLSNQQNLFTEINGKKMDFNIIIGNPPYNSQGNIKVPTNHQSKKKEDGKSIWRDFTKKAISLLKPEGFLNFIIPSIWMKPDKSNMYNFLTQYNLQNIHCFTNTETNRIFRGEAQTPTCYFLLKNTEADKLITLFDKHQEKYIGYELLPQFPIPVFGASVIQKLIPYVKKVGNIQAIKTNEPSKKAEFSVERTEKYKYPCILSAILEQQEPIKLQLKTNYSSTPQKYFAESKIILAHKMFGFPIMDSEGKWGISRRDNYVILDKSKDNLFKIFKFLSTYFALYVFESTRYRMKYLEKYAFQFIPDITKLTDFPDTINDKTISEYFGFTESERNAILSLHNKKYF